MAGWAPSAVSAIAGIAGSAVMVISDCVASSVVEKIVDTGISFLRRRLMPVNIESELKRLQIALPQIKSVMGIAEALKVKDPSSGEWFDQFRRAVDASEDVLDELEYKKLEDMVKNRDEDGGSTSCSKKRKSCRISEDILKRLREAVTMLDQATADVEHLRQRAMELEVLGLSESWQEASKVLKRETTSFLAETKVFGRDFEMDKIISWLKRPNERPLSSFGIFGLGGLGKTTLAQLAYQEMKGSNYFDQTIWICVSAGFSVEGITRKILGELCTNNFGGDKPLNTLQVALKEKTKSNKIFLVLDDIWDDEIESRSAWEQLIVPLRFVQQGSKILFTTRFKSVVNLLSSVINTEHEYLQLEGLGKQDLGSLFNSYAFHGFNRDDHGDLRAIGDQMIKMLKGNPLAAKVIGSLLNSRPNHQYWSRILNRDSLFNIEQAKDVLEVLKLSYYHLPTNLQVCFRFCSIFPQDHVFDKNELIKMWMAAGFICQGSGQERPEDIGEDYFNHLLEKSFFEYSQSGWGNRCYVMHDLMHELAQNIANGECCRVEPNNKPLIIPNSVRHISIYESEIERVCHLENLHSLVIYTSDKKLTSTQSNSFVFPSKLTKKKLRLLAIYGTRKCQLPEEMSCLVHLRYLCINLCCFCYRQSFKYLLHASIYKLYHLQVLQLLGNPFGSSYMDIETAGITNLVKLRHMRLPKEIMQTIRGVHMLTSLQELTFFVGKKNGHQINELGTLHNLRHLSIYNIENVGDPSEAKGANLLQKKNLISLYLEWTENSHSSNPEQIIGNLQPHSNLRNLTIQNYEGQRFPSWMVELPQINLSSLELCNCPYLDKFPDMSLSLTEFHIQNVGLTSLPNVHGCSTINTIATVSQKSSLKVVEINECPNLISLDGFLQQANLYLPAIESLIIDNCERLVNLPTQGFGNLTSLKQLTLYNCSKMVGVGFQGNLLPENLQKLEMWKCGELDVPLLKASCGLTNLTHLEISNCANITSITISGNSFRSLRRLGIYSCYGLVELLFLEETHVLNQQSNFNILKMSRIYIIDCPNLTRVPNLPLSLIEFSIYNVAMTRIPQYGISSNSSNGDLSTAPLESVLREVKISNWQNLKSLNGGFGRFMSLTRLDITDCPLLVLVNSQINLLPMTLESLSISNCGELDVSLLESASRLTTLTDLHLSKCANITHIPCSRNAFGSLRKLCIKKCDKLVEHSSRDKAHGVNMLGSSLASLNINDLEIDNLSLLLIEPLRSLRFVANLRISNCSEKEAFPEQWLMQNSKTLASFDAATVESLPATMASLTALENLIIYNADMLKVLPDLPASLLSVVIRRARSLKSLPATMANLTALNTLEIRNVDLLEKLPELPASLMFLRIGGARSLKSLPTTMSNLTALTILEITDADLLAELPELPASLEFMDIIRSDGVRILT